MCSRRGGPNGPSSGASSRTIRASYGSRRWLLTQKSIASPARTRDVRRRRAPRGFARDVLTGTGRVEAGEPSPALRCLRRIFPSSATRRRAIRRLRGRRTDGPVDQGDRGCVRRVCCPRTHSRFVSVMKSTCLPAIGADRIACRSDCRSAVWRPNGERRNSVASSRFGEAAGRCIGPRCCRSSLSNVVT